MPRYRFKARDGSSELACVVRQIENPDDVRREAIRFAASLLFDGKGLLVVPDDWRLDVVDDADEVCIRLLYP